MNRYWLASQVAVLLFCCTLEAVTIEGIVVRDDSGAAITSAEVKVAREGQARLEAHLETDTSGRFRVEDLPDGRYTIRVARPGFLDAAVPVPADGRAVGIRLIQTSRIAGTVRWRDGRPLARGRVFLMERMRSGALKELHVAHASALSRPDGSYELRGLPPGSYVLGFRYQASDQYGGGLYPETAHPQVFELKGGDNFPNCDLTAEAGTLYSIRGRLQAPEEDSGSASVAAGADAALQAAAKTWSVGVAAAGQPELSVAWIRTQADGSFELPAVPEGSYEIYGAGPVIGFSFRGNMLAQDRQLLYGRMPLQVNSDVEDLVLTLGPGRRAAVVVDAPKSGAAQCLGSIDVTLRALEAWGSELDQTLRIPIGEPFPIENLAPTRYALVATLPDAECNLPFAAELDLRNDDVAEPLRLRASTKGGIAGTVAERAPGNRYQVVLVPLGAAAGQPIVVTDADDTGSFHFDDLRPGRYGLAVRMAGDGDTRMVADPLSLAEVEVLGGQVEIVLNEPFENAPFGNVPVGNAPASRERGRQ